MANEETEEGIKAIETRVHRYGGPWAREGRWEFTIHEYTHETFIALAADFEEARGIRWLVSQQIAALVAKRISEEHVLICADGTSAYLHRMS